jgi:outer membrane beta-barrel protein
MGWLNKSIIPFDIYFTIGGGITNTNQNTNPGTAHVGFGQMFALNKWAAVRLDLSWYGYQSTSQVSGTNSSGTYSNIYATLGASFFFPEAEYR